MESALNNTRKDVYSVVTRNQQDYWIRIGVAFVNRDGSLRVLLDAYPINNTLLIRDPSERPARGQNGAAARGATRDLGEVGS